MPGWLRRRPVPTDAAEERGDVLALLEKRRANCATVIAANRPESERAMIVRAELDVLIGIVRSGLHQGEAAVRADIWAGES